MPGGKGNIDGKVDGVQFSSTYKPQEKWTEEEALKLGEELIEWMGVEAVTENMFFEEFLIMKKHMQPKTLAYLAKKFTSFLTLLSVAKKIQELKLKKYGTADKLNASITKFVLINNHDYRDKKEITGKDGAALNPKIMIELIDTAAQVDKPEEESNEQPKIVDEEDDFDGIIDKL